MKHLLYITTILVFSSCVNSIKDSSQLYKYQSVYAVRTSLNGNVDTNKPPSNKEKTKIDNKEDNPIISWVNEYPDSSSYSCRIVFEDEYALYWFHGQCIYYFFTYDNKDTINLLWSYKPDCVFNMDFLEKQIDGYNAPKTSSIFANYIQLNDSVMKVDYNYPEWTRKINEIKKDSIFPNYLYKQK